MNGTKSKSHRERIDALNARARQRQTEDEAMGTAHEHERAELDERHAAARTAHRAESIALLEQDEKDAERTRLEQQAEIANEVVPPFKAALAKFVDMPSTAAVSACIAMWQALCARCSAELGDKPHHAIVVAGLCNDDPRLGSALDVLNDTADPFGAAGPVGTKARLLEYAAKIEARLARAAPNKERTDALAQLVAHGDVERRMLGKVKLYGDAVHDGRTWRTIPPGKSAADVLAKSSIADAFRKPAPSAAPASHFADRQSRSTSSAGRTNDDVAASLSLARAYEAKR